ncbi:MAG: hypothetical protein LLG05_03285 [Porphyromonadaceae bacterium]|nr:hypothetical protein [Porphyromonadaceae bacterium]
MEEECLLLSSSRVIPTIVVVSAQRKRYYLPVEEAHSAELIAVKTSRKGKNYYSIVKIKPVLNSTQTIESLKDTLLTEEEYQALKHRLLVSMRTMHEPVLHRLRENLSKEIQATEEKLKYSKAVFINQKEN